MATKTKTTEDEDLQDETPLNARMGNMMIGSNSAGLSLHSLDLSKASSGFKLLPVDTDITFRIEKVEAKVSGTGNNMLVVGLVDKETSTKVSDYVVYSGDNPWKFKSMCHSTGLLSEDGSSFTGENERDFIGKEVVARIQHDLYQGEKRNKIKGSYKPVDGATESDVDDPDF